MKKKNYEHPFLKVSHKSIGEILCTEINTSVGDIIIGEPGEDGVDNW